ncbi:MAG: hypothetical protein QHJ73_01140 [Armatimonadota bacterium]|nr:hypothetical protein [Armatimonadota bacterium]
MRDPIMDRREEAPDTPPVRPAVPQPLPAHSEGMEREYEPAPPSLVHPAEELVARRDMKGLALLFAQRADDASFAHREAAMAIHEWLVWVCEKLGSLTSLSEEELVLKVRLWGRRLDYYLWADPAEHLRPHIVPGDPLFDDSVMVPLVRHLSERQRDVREYLRAHGITRIEADSGSAFLPGLVERSDRPSEPTRDLRLDERVFRVEPGDGGYRLGEKVLIPSRARRYKYRPDA